jgi:hypothetical protein
VSSFTMKPYAQLTLPYMCATFSLPATRTNVQVEILALKRE